MRQKYYHMWEAYELSLVTPLPNGLEKKMYAGRSHGVYKIDKISLLRSPTLEVIYIQPRSLRVRINNP